MENIHHRSKTKKYLGVFVYQNFNSVIFQIKNRNNFLILPSNPPKYPLLRDLNNIDHPPQLNKLQINIYN